MFFKNDRLLLFVNETVGLTKKIYTNISHLRIDWFYFKRQRDLFDGPDAIGARDQSNVSIVKAGNLNKKW